MIFILYKPYHVTSLLQRLPPHSESKPTNPHTAGPPWPTLPLSPLARWHPILLLHWLLALPALGPAMFWALSKWNPLHLSFIFSKHFFFLSEYIWLLDCRWFLILLYTFFFTFYVLHNKDKTFYYSVKSWIEVPINFSCSLLKYHHQLSQFKSWHFHDCLK